MTRNPSKWPARIVIVRHAESEGNYRRTYLQTANSSEHYLGLDKRDADYVLTPLGREQAQATGRGLNEYGPFDVGFVSPYVRTIQTAEHIVAGLDPPPRLVPDERIREKEFGTLEGVTKHGREELFPEEHARRERVGKYYWRPPGGESYPDVNLRVHSLLGTLIREHAGENLLIVTHSVVVLCFRCLLERLDEKEVIRIDEQDEVPNAGVLVYEPGDREEGERITPVAWNRVYYH